MAQQATINVNVTDLPEVKATLDEASREIKRLRQECKDWEAVLDELQAIAALGGNVDDGLWYDRLTERLRERQGPTS